MGSPDFRVAGRIFATLAAAKLGYGNIMITPEQQAAFVDELPEVFIPVEGGWGRNGATHVRLDLANRRSSPAHYAPRGSFAAINTPRLPKQALHGQSLNPRRALLPKSASSV
jgi:hypothetical protein